MKNFLLKNNIGFTPPRFSSKKSGEGFTLVEALVAISILLIAVVGPLSIVAQSIQTANIAKDQVTAFYLAQEAVEYIRNIRDSNVLLGSNWMAGLGTCQNSNTCRIDAVNNNITNCSGDGVSCKKLDLLKNTTTKLTLYSYGSLSGFDLTPTTFTRSVNIKESISGQEAVITVTMSWQTGLVPRSFIITERIFNWSG